jgi:DNA-binding NarL/FixJ family response regulator
MSAPFATILFTELVGAESLYQRRDEATAEAVRRAWLGTLRMAVGEHGGREVRATAHGLMASFDSAVAAVRCAVAMQRAADDGGGGLQLRVGLDAGEPLGEGHDLHGMPVTVASRLCDIAEPGEILASDLIRQIVGPRSAEVIEPAGAMRLRGVVPRVSVARIHWTEEGIVATAGLPAALPRPITVVVADDQRLLRAGFRVIIEAESDMTVVGEAPDGRSAVDVVLRRRPDVVLMDIRMPELDGLKAAERIIGESDLGTAVLMLTTFDLNEYVYEALRIGASGFLLKDTPADRLLDAIRVVAAGDALLAPSITRRLIGRFAQAARSRNVWRSSRPVSSRSCAWSPRASQTPRSPGSSWSARTPSRPTSPTFSPSSTCATGCRRSSSPTRRASSHPVPVRLDACVPPIRQVSRRHCPGGAWLGIRGDQRVDVAARHGRVRARSLAPALEQRVCPGVGLGLRKRLADCRAEPADGARAAGAHPVEPHLAHAGILSV